MQIKKAQQDLRRDLMVLNRLSEEPLERPPTTLTKLREAYRVVAVKNPLGTPSQIRLRKAITEAKTEADALLSDPTKRVTLDDNFHKHFLLGLKASIETTACKIGGLGGGKIITLGNDKKIKVPSHVAKIYEKCCAMPGGTNPEATSKTLNLFNEVVKIGRKADSQSSFFRSPETKAFYAKFKTPQNEADENALPGIKPMG